MQLFIAFAVCIYAASALTEEQMNMMKALKEECIKETGVDPEMVLRAREGEKIDDDKLNCFVACVFENAGIANEDGTMNKALAIEKLPEDVPREDAIKLIETCGDKKGKDKCHTASLVLACMHENKSFKVFEAADV